MVVPSVPIKLHKRELLPSLSYSYIMKSIYDCDDKSTQIELTLFSLPFSQYQYQNHQNQNQNHQHQYKYLSVKMQHVIYFQKP